jgi:hypothetical protein
MAGLVPAISYNPRAAAKAWDFRGCPAQEPVLGLRVARTREPRMTIEPMLDQLNESKTGIGSFRPRAHYPPKWVAPAGRAAHSAIVANCRVA